MKITFWGAARQVTGSMHLLELPSGARVLIDCGLDYEKRKEFEERKFDFCYLNDLANLIDELKNYKLR